MSPNSYALTVVDRFQSEVEALRQTGEPIRERLAVRTLAAFVITLAGLSTVMPLDRVVTSTGGKIVSTETVSILQSLDTSIIKSIEIKPGQEVKKGQLLATLDPTFTAADLDQLRQQVASLDAQITRCEAELNGRVPAFSGLKSEDHSKYIALQQALYVQRRGQYEAQLNSFDAKISQVNATISKLEADENRYRERERISRQIESMRETLIQRQAGSLLSLLTATDQRLELLRVIENQYNSLLESKQVIAATRADRTAFQQQWLATVSQEMVTARNQRDLANAQLAKAAKHQELVRLVAPEDSVVLEIAKVSNGSVLKVGDPFLTLMPARVPVEAEINIASRDVGFVRAGDDVALKIDAFDFLQHGSAKGKIRWISENAFVTDENNKPVDAYYRARIRFEKTELAHVPSSFRLIPGMTLIADINVGTRTVAQYVLGGVMKGYSEAMRER
ncbi:HlyD family type I secretion periplasmic adaptor subunit [Methylobacterium hispanicum]|uniref:HlyD family type I secretion periplasmic adaptor subunit n=1 Tax=Methylobacterium hispanicum TaxID=270350 RepID=UPI002F31E08E